MKKSEDFASDEVKQANYTQSEGDYYASMKSEEKNVIEIELYDIEKTIEENFEDGSDKKYLLTAVASDLKLGFETYDTTIPTPNSKVVVNMDMLEGECLYAPITYSSFMGIELINFMRFNSKVLDCQERVFLMALLVKYRSFGFKPFYWTKTDIFKEVGIKKDKANSIIETLSKMNLISTEVVKTKLNGEPRQATYFTIKPRNIVSQIDSIFNNDEEFDITEGLKKFLRPGLRKNRKKHS